MTYLSSTQYSTHWVGIYIWDQTRIHHAHCAPRRFINDNIYWRTFRTNICRVAFELSCRSYLVHPCYLMRIPSSVSQLHHKSKHQKTATGIPCRLVESVWNRVLPWRIPMAKNLLPIDPFRRPQFVTDIPPPRRPNTTKKARLPVCIATPITTYLSMLPTCTCLGKVFPLLRSFV